MTSTVDDCRLSSPLLFRISQWVMVTTRLNLQYEFETLNFQTNLFLRLK